MEVSGDIRPGGTVTFTTYAYVDPPAPGGAEAEVLEMIYEVWRDCDEGQVIANSGSIPAEYLGDYRYMTTWDWVIPTEGSGDVCYYIWADIICAWKLPEASLINSQTQPVVLAGNTQKLGFFEILSRAVRSFFGLSVDDVGVEVDLVSISSTWQAAPTQ